MGIFQLLGADYTHHVIIVMGLSAELSLCLSAIHTVFRGEKIDLLSFGGGAAAIITATGAALGMGVPH